MALNPYTLYHLYDKGILECVPTDLVMGSPRGAMMPMNNSYLDMAQQGGLYLNHGISSDSFQMNNCYANQYGLSQNSSYGVTAAGANSNAGIYNTFNGYGVGTQNINGVADSFGFNNQLGSQSNTSIAGTFGFQNPQSGFLNKTASIISSTPKIVLGVIAGGIGIVGLMAAFKRGKKPPKTATNKTGFWNKLKFWKKK